MEFCGKFDSSKFSEKDKQLVEATMAGNLQDIQALVQEGANINIETRIYYKTDTSLIIAIAIVHGYIDLVTFFLDMNIDYTQHTLLSLACQSGQLHTLFHLLVRLECLHTLTMDHKIEYIGYAVTYRHVEMSAWLLFKYPLEKKNYSQLMLDCIQSMSGSVIEDECKYIKPEYAHRTKRLVRLLLEYGADVNYCNGVPLYYAMLHGLFETVRVLLGYGADVSLIQHYPRCTVFEALLKSTVFNKPSFGKHKLLIYYHNLGHVLRMMFLIKNYETDKSKIEMKFGTIYQDIHKIYSDYSRYQAWLLEKMAGVLVGQPYPDELKQLPKTMIFTRELHASDSLLELDKMVRILCTYVPVTKKSIYQPLEKELETCEQKPNLMGMMGFQPQLFQRVQSTQDTVKSTTNSTNLFDEEINTTSLLNTESVQAPVGAINSECSRSTSKGSNISTPVSRTFDSGQKQDTLGSNNNKNQIVTCTLQNSFVYIILRDIVARQQQINSMKYDR